MSRDVPAAPPGRVVTDFDRLADLFPDWQGTFQQMTRGPFAGVLRGTRGRHAFAHCAVVNQSILARGREGVPAVNVGLAVPRLGNAVWQGRRVPPGRLVVRGPDVDVCHRSDKPGFSLHLAAPVPAFAQALRAAARTDTPVTGWSVVDVAPPTFRRLESLVSRFLDAAAEGPGQGLVEAEQACLAAAAEALAAHGGPRDDLPSPSRAALVRRATDLMHARLDRPTGEIDLCEHLGVSGRTLRLAFRERTGLGPLAYFQLLRLHAVRTALRAADPARVAIGGLARQYGFTHPGKFAGYYRRLFGESPSRSLSPAPRRAAGPLPLGSRFG